MSEFRIDDRLFNASPSPVASSTPIQVTGRRWWWSCPQPLTWAVVLGVGSVLAYGQFLRVEQHFKTTGPTYSLGWPYFYAMKWSPDGPLDGIRWRNLAGDIGWWFAMITPPMIIAERLARRRCRPSAKTLMSASAAAAILLTWTDWMSHYFTIRYEPRRAAFELVLLVVCFCWLEIVALGVISTVAAVWHRSSHPFTLVASYTFIGLTVIGFDMWLYSNGFMRSENVLWDWLHWTMFFGAGVTLLFGALVWLSAAVSESIDNYRKLPRIDND